MTSVDVSVEALKHVSEWARRCTLGGIEMDPELLATLDRADIDRRSPDAPAIDPPVDGMVPLTVAGADELLALDCKHHGYGANRCLRSERTDCAPCAELGAALEKLVPRLGVRRKRAQSAGSVCG